MATSYLSPGVYVEEVDRGTKPLEMVGTSTCAFIGEVSTGPVNEPVLCTNWSQFTKHFGDFDNSEFLAHAVYGFFNNGGGRCFVLNVGADDKTDKKAAKYIGTDNGPGTRTGLKAFEDLDDVNMVVAPGQTDPAIVDALLSHCENMRYRFAILDAPEVIEKGGVDKLPKPRDSKYGAYYFPWIEVYDPKKGNRVVPPSGRANGRRARGAQGPRQRDRPRSARAEVHGHQGRAGYPESQGNKLHSRVPQSRYSGLGCAYHLVRCQLALSERPPALQYGGAVDRAGNPVGRVRAQ